MTARDIDEYLAALDEPKQSTLRTLRETIRELLPEATECISYQLPAFRVGKVVIAGFGAFSRHLSYLPHSGSVLPALGDQLAGYSSTKSALHFAVDTPLDPHLVQALIRVRLEEAGLAPT